MTFNLEETCPSMLGCFPTCLDSRAPWGPTGPYRALYRALHRALLGAHDQTVPGPAPKRWSRFPGPTTQLGFKPGGSDSSLEAQIEARGLGFKPGGSDSSLEAQIAHKNI